MAFTPEPTRGPQEIYSLAVIAKYESELPVPHIVYQVEILMTDGSIVKRSGELRPHLTQGQVDTIETFLSNMVGKATAEMVSS